MIRNMKQQISTMKTVNLALACAFAALTFAKSHYVPDFDAQIETSFYNDLDYNFDNQNKSCRSDLRTPTHIVGVVIPPPGSVTVTGPDSGSPSTSANTWTLNIDSHPVVPNSADANPDVKFLLLHFTEVSLPGNNRLEVDLGYATDIFTAASGTQFWTRPINIKALLGAPVIVRYIADGATTGKARLDLVGVGQRHDGEDGRPSFSNCDPFFTESTYLEPKYDPWWYCTDPPQWQNVGCVTDPNDIRARMARSVGMIVSPQGNYISTCSVTLIDTDQVITAGHCHNPDQALASSVTFDFQTDCSGNRLQGYNPRFFRVLRVLDHVYANGIDFSRLQIERPPSTIPPIQLRPDSPGVGEKIFGIHHPNGAVKKLSIPLPGFGTIVSSDENYVQVTRDMHVSGGSSGSGLFDTAGRLLGVLSLGDPCLRTKVGPFYLSYYPASSILNTIAPTAPNPVTRDVMVVFDHSGSMSELDSTKRTKIEVARDAVSLFVQLVRPDVGNRIGMVSFSTAATNPIDFSIANVIQSNKQVLIGTAPFAGGKVGALIPSGSTSIGDGLEKARLQLTPPGTNKRAILLMTDGMENTAPLVKNVEGALPGIDVHAIGFGTAANLDGSLLSKLTSEHNGMYTQASSGVALQKFFSSAFGNIFEAGILHDPEYDLPGNQDISQPVQFSVCGETAITIAVGWDDLNGALRVNLTSPGGAVITGSTQNVEESSGRSWTFLRVPLPIGGEQRGNWNVTVYRPRVIITRAISALLSRQTSSPPLHYFLNIIPSGGPTLQRNQDQKTYYTGDILNPLVSFTFADGSFSRDVKVELTMTRPNYSIGAILSHERLKSPISLNGDTVPARQATLRGLTSSIAATVDETFQLTSTPEDTGGYFEEGSTFGKNLSQVLRVEGDYLFHFRARTDGNCVYNRELLWSLHVDVSIDPANTNVTTTITGTGPDGKSTGTVTIFPRDPYGNPVGPGKSGDIPISGTPGTTITGPVIDNGDGSYTIPISSDPTLGDPGVVVAQPGRPPIVLTTGACKSSGKCELCVSTPDRNRCDPSSACSGTPFGTMCTCAPGYRVDSSTNSTDTQWRLKWPTPGQEHRVYVSPGQICNKLCDQWYLGPMSCQEVAVKEC